MPTKPMDVIHELTTLFPVYPDATPLWDFKKYLNYKIIIIAAISFVNAYIYLKIQKDFQICSSFSFFS
ncbi:hypothetical protein BaGK_07610 [Bacillus atrophaeus]|nr:hypothetical protein BaGK_07610 [Bacillus atrophaeus]